MGIHDVAAIHPASLDLPEYKINITITEIDGPDVRIYCGCRKGGIHIHWLYSCVMRADDLLDAVQRSTAAAMEAINQNIAETLREARTLRH